MEIQISQCIESAPEAVMIRKSVFMEEQGFVNEFDSIDEYAFHAVLFSENKIPAATGRLFSEDGKSFTIGRVAVMKDFRGTGLGRLIVSELENKARELGGIETKLSAQLRAKEFYEKLGYSPFGEEYLDEYCPHISMRKIL